jgi:hypothetical protein
MSPPVTTRHRPPSITSSCMMPSASSTGSPGRTVGGKRQLHHVARLAGDVTVEPQLGSAQVLKDRHRPARGHLAYDGDAPPVLLVRAVRKVEPHHVHARVDQGANALFRIGRRPERGHDAGASHGYLLPGPV